MLVLVEVTLVRVIINLFLKSILRCLLNISHLLVSFIVSSFLLFMRIFIDWSYPLEVGKILCHQVFSQNFRNCIKVKKIIFCWWKVDDLARISWWKVNILILRRLKGLVGQLLQHILIFCFHLWWNYCYDNYSSHLYAQITTFFVCAKVPAQGLWVHL